MLPNSLVQRILQRFPGKLTYCFAYGSGVKKQVGYDDKAQKDAMIDLVLCVDDSYDWHAQNLIKNPRDYSLMRYLGPNLISGYQQYAAGVYFNTLIPIDEHTTIKYGVIETADLREDLYHWMHLYIAGRLHKPVETLVEPTDLELKKDIALNLQSALHVALLQLPKQFSYFDLFHAIANISYHGDFRMYFGEKKDKVKNIVEPQLDAFLKLYAPQLKKMSHCVHVPDLISVNSSWIEQSKSHETILEHLEALPSTCREVLTHNKQPLSKLAHTKNYGETVKAITASINWENSISQSLKNIPTAGLWKSFRYSSKKIAKMFSK